MFRVLAPPNCKSDECFAFWRIPVANLMNVSRFGVSRLQNRWMFHLVVAAVYRYGECFVFWVHRLHIEHIWFFKDYHGLLRVKVRAIGRCADPNHTALFA